MPNARENARLSGTVPQFQELDTPKSFRNTSAPRRSSFIAASTSSVDRVGLCGVLVLNMLYFVRCGREALLRL